MYAFNLLKLRQSLLIGINKINSKGSEKNIQKIINRRMQLCYARQNKEASPLDELASLFCKWGGQRDSNPRMYESQSYVFGLFTMATATYVKSRLTPASSSLWWS